VVVYHSSKWCVVGLKRNELPDTPCHAAHQDPVMSDE